MRARRPGGMSSTVVKSTAFSSGSVESFISFGRSSPGFYPSTRYGSTRMTCVSSLAAWPMLSRMVSSTAGSHETALPPAFFCCSISDIHVAIHVCPKRQLHLVHGNQGRHGRLPIILAAVHGHVTACADVMRLLILLGYFSRALTLVWG